MPRARPTLGAADRVDDNAGAVGRILDREAHFKLDRRAAEPAPLHANEGDLVVALPRHIIGRADVDVARGEPPVQLRLDGFRLGHLLRPQPIPGLHIEKVRVAPGVQLIGPVIRSPLVRVNPAQLHAALRTWHEAHGGGDSALAIDGKTIRGAIDADGNQTHVLGKRRIETAFGVTSLTPETATPERLLTLNRGHWTIEAAHHILDWSFDEDRSRIRTGHGPENSDPAPALRHRPHKGPRPCRRRDHAQSGQKPAPGPRFPENDRERLPAGRARLAEGRLTRKGAREMRAAFAKTILVVDEGSLASTVQARDLLRIANELRIPSLVLVGDAKQLDAVDAGKPFAQLQAAGMKTAVMDEIMRQRDPALKEAVEASLKGDIGRAFEKLGSNVAEVKADNIAGAVAARWLRLDPKARESTGVMAPSHELRRKINGHIRDRLAREGRIHGPAMESERLVSRGYTNAEKALVGNYAPGDVVAFHRTYKRIGVDKGGERRVMGVDRKARAVLLDDGKGGRVAWKPEEIGGRRGGSEVYRAEEIELRAGDRIRWTRNDAGLGLVNSRTAEVVRVANGRVTFRLEDGKTLELGKGDPQLRHLDHAWASTVHAFQGRTVDSVIAAMESRHKHLTTQNRRHDSSG